MFPTCSSSSSSGRQQSPIDVEEESTRDLSGRVRIANYALNVSLVQINTGKGGQPGHFSFCSQLVIEIFP